MFVGVITHRRSLKERTAIVIAFITWGIVGVTLSWHVIVLMWAILPLFFSSNLYIPETVRMTSYTMAILMVWILVVYVLSMGWVKYNSSRLKQKNDTVNAFNQTVFIENDLLWSEAMISKIDLRSILEEVENLKKNMSVVTLQDSVNISHVSIRKPQKLLSKAIKLIRAGRLLNGISILRVILELPESSSMVKMVANIKLAQCLYELGYKDLAVRINTEVI